MTDSMVYDEGLEEIWRIKREIAAEYPSLDEYFKGMEAYRNERLRDGVQLVRLYSRNKKTSQTGEGLFVAEAPVEYDAGAKPDASPSRHDGN